LELKRKITISEKTPTMLPFFKFFFVITSMSMTVMMFMRITPTTRTQMRDYKAAEQA
jgi:hypothetical protein